MKKLLLLILTALLPLGMVYAQAENASTVYTSGDYEYILLEDGTAQIVAYWGNKKELKIPETLGKYTVTSIGDSAFHYCDSLTAVTIPNSVISIVGNPFAGYSNISKITVSSNHPAFDTIDNVLFDKTNKTLLCYPLACKNSSYTIPEDTLIIGDYAFSGCTYLTSISIPDSIISIGANPFISCSSLTNVIVSPDSLLLATIDGVLFNKVEKALVCYPVAYTNRSYAIPQGIQIIGENAFYYCDSLTSISIPDSVTSIEFQAFCYCTALTSISIPDSVTYIGDAAFNWCNELSSINIPSSITSIGYYAFASCCSLTSLDIPDSITAIGHHAFAGCSSLVSISIPHSVASIGDSIFAYCSSLKTITVPRNSYAAQYCKENNLPYTYPDSLDWLLN